MAEYNRKEQLARAAKNIDYEATHTGNKWGEGIKDPNERQIAYRSYCDHLSKGKSKDAWYYENLENGAHWTWNTMEAWIKETDEFDPFLKKKAEAKAFGFYEDQLNDSISGTNTKVNIAGLQMAMRNKYGWDRQDRREVNTPEVLASYEKVMIMLSDKQKEIKSLEDKPIDIKPSSDASS